MSTKLNERLDRLTAALRALDKLHGDLHDAASEKLVCMRRADAAGIRQCTDREQSLIEQIGRWEGERRGLTEQIGRAFGLSARSAAKMTARQLAERCAEPRKSEILSLADRLRSAAGRLARINRIVGAASAQVLGHLRRVLSAMTCGPAGEGVYDIGGQPCAATPTGGSGRLFEVMG